MFRSFFRLLTYLGKPLLEEVVLHEGVDSDGRRELRLQENKTARLDHFTFGIFQGDQIITARDMSRENHGFDFSKVNKTWKIAPLYERYRLGVARTASKEETRILDYLWAHYSTNASYTHVNSEK